MDSLSDELEKEFQEDSDSDDEFEKKLQESYQQHVDSSRPISTQSNRPQTASRHRDDFSVGMFTIPPFQVYTKLAQFISSNQLQKPDLLRVMGEYPSFSKFKSGFNELGIELTDDEVLAVFRQNGVAKTGLLRMLDIYPKIVTDNINTQTEKPFDDNADHLREEAEKLLQHSTSRFSKKLKCKQKSEKSIRPQSGSLRVPRTGISRPISAYTGKTAQLKSGKEFLKQSKQKQKEEEKELALVVERCKKEFEYDCLHKMGEANEIAQSMNLPTTYRAIKKDNGTTKCHIYRHDQFVEEVTLENFLREWRKLKRSQKPSMNIPKKPPKSEKSPEPSPPNTAKVSKKERQEELKELLLETKELTNKLKEQVKILENKGIVPKSIHSNTQFNTFF